MSLVNLFKYGLRIIGILVLFWHAHCFSAFPTNDMRGLGFLANQGDKHSIFTIINTLRENNDLASAESLATNYLKTHPKDVDVTLLLGLILYQKSEYDRSAFYFQSVLTQSPNYLDAKIGLIRVRIAQKKIDQAATLMKDVIKQDPENPQVKEIETFYQKAVADQPPKPKPIITQPAVNVLKQVKELIKAKKLDAAKSLALTHLKTHPDDVDIMLMLGLIYYQTSNLDQAEYYFNSVLTKSPNYLDAKVGLTRIKIAKKQYQQASLLIKQLVKQDPKSPQVIEIQDAYRKAKMAEHKAIAINKKNLFINQEIEKEHLLTILAIINQDLRRTPHDPDLLLAKARIYFKYHLYGQSAHFAQEVLKRDPKSKAAQGLLSEIRDVNPHFLCGLNEVGFGSLNQYVSDLHAPWGYSTFYYARETEYGRLSARLNYAQRFNEGAPQIEFTFSPVINPYIYFDFFADFANKPALFPKYAVSGEGFLTIPNLLTISAGEYYAYILGAASYKKYTGSLSKSFSKYWVSARVNHYVPKRGSKSTLYIASIRRYFNTNDFFATLTVGKGKSPDLADLTTLDFIVIKNKFINLDLTFPLCHHSTLMDVGISYANWKFPRGLIRRLYGINVGINYRF